MEQEVSFNTQQYLECFVFFILVLQVKVSKYVCTLDFHAKAELFELLVLRILWRTCRGEEWNSCCVSSQWKPPLLKQQSEVTSQTYLSCYRAIVHQYLVSDNPEQNKNYSLLSNKIATIYGISVLNCSVLSDPRWGAEVSPLSSFGGGRNLFSLLFKYFRSLRRVACQLSPSYTHFDTSLT